MPLRIVPLSLRLFSRNFPSLNKLVSTSLVTNYFFPVTMKNIDNMCETLFTCLRKVPVLRKLITAHSNISCFKLYFIPNVAHIGQEIWKVWVEISLRPHVKYGCHKVDFTKHPIARLFFKEFHRISWKYDKQLGRNTDRTMGHVLHANHCFYCIVKKA